MVARRSRRLANYACSGFARLVREIGESGRTRKPLKQVRWADAPPEVVMDKIVGEFDKCDECESLVDVYVEFHSRRGDLVKVCMNCLASTIVRPTPRAADGLKALCEKELLEACEKTWRKFD